jgi:hypothetical protein
MVITRARLGSKSPLRRLALGFVASDNGYGVPDSIVGLVGIEVGHVDMRDDEGLHLVEELDAIEMALKFYVSFTGYKLSINRALILSMKPWQSV